MSNATFYAVNYWLKNNEGQVVDTSEGGTPMCFVEGSAQVISGIQQAVKGREPGARLDVTIPPELAYGPRQDNLINRVPKSAFEGIEELKPGMKFQTNSGEQMQIVQVLEVHDNEVTIDANHPLAGFTLNFELEILEAREATSEECEQYLKQV